MLKRSAGQRRICLISSELKIALGSEANPPTLQIHKYLATGQ